MKIKKICFSICMIIITFVVSANVYGASSISTNTKKLNIGDKVTVNATVSGVASWNMKISASGQVKFISGSLQSSDASENAQDTTKTITAVFEATGEGNATFSLSGDTTTAASVNSKITGNTSISITKKADPPAPPTPQPIPPTNKEENNTKSNNNYLKSLQVSEEGLSPRFIKTKTSYSLAVGENINELKVTANPEDGKARVNISGNTNLKDGDNNVIIKVTAENGSTRTYKIVVTKSVNKENSNAYLENLVVEGYSFTPDFSSEVLEYDLGIVSKSITKLNILTFAKNTQASVEIIGNENLEAGEGKIVIKITAVDKTTTKEYILKYIKEEGIVKEESDNLVDIYGENSNLDTTKKNTVSGFFKNIFNTIKSNALLLIMYLLVIIEFIEILYLYKKLNGKFINFKCKEKAIKNEIEENNLSRRKRNVFNEDSENLKQEEIKNEENEEVEEPKEEN